MTRPQCECPWSIVDDDNKCVSTYTHSGQTIHAGCGRYRDDRSTVCSLCKCPSPDFDVCDTCAPGVIRRAQEVAHRTKDWNK
jgi:hypothetical protein